jgi:NADH:ubiquinone oxidoreductase subunit 6 (subunit J)
MGFYYYTMFADYIVSICLYYLIFFLLVLMSILCLLTSYFKDSVYSVLTLILIFMVASFTLLALNVEFLAYVYIIVYVGAVVLLFIFVIFMLGPVYIKTYQEESFFFFYFFLVKFLFLFSLAVWDFIFFTGYYKYTSTMLPCSVYNNDILIISNLLYTEHFFLLWMVGIVLLVAMIGPIIFHFNKQ